MSLPREGGQNAALCVCILHITDQLFLTGCRNTFQAPMRLMIQQMRQIAQKSQKTV